MHPNGLRTTCLVFALGLTASAVQAATGNCPAGTIESAGYCWTAGQGANPAEGQKVCNLIAFRGNESFSVLLTRKAVFESYPELSAVCGVEQCQTSLSEQGPVVRCRAAVSNPGQSRDSER
jgi:hypothetical protein